MRRGGGGRGEYSTGCGGGGDGGGGGNECVREISGSGAADRAGAVTRVIVTAIHTRDAHAVSKVVRRRLLIGHVKAYANADGHASQVASVSQVVSNISLAQQRAQLFN